VFVFTVLTPFAPQPQRDGHVSRSFPTLSLSLGSNVLSTNRFTMLEPTAIVKLRMKTATETVRETVVYTSFLSRLPIRNSDPVSTRSTMLEAFEKTLTLVPVSLWLTLT
jgi:hypothetical protein